MRVGRPWLPRRLNGLWLAAITLLPRPVLLTLPAGTRYLPPRRSKAAWRLVHRMRLDGRAVPIPVAKRRAL